MINVRRIFCPAAIATLSVLLAFGCDSKPAMNSLVGKEAPAATPVIPKNGNYNGKGIVTKINTELGSIEFNHEEIPGLMPPMIMEFFVKDKALLNGLNVGDKVDFVIEYNHPAETVIAVTKIR